MGSLLTVQSKTRQLVPFVPNQTQIRIFEAIYNQIEQGRPVRLLELKGRQQGSSTGIGAYCFLRAICEPGTNALIITEEKGGSASNIFNMYKKFLQSFPLELSTEFTREGQLLRFAEPMSSSIKVEGEKAVTSFTFQLVHLSEAGFFANLGQTLAMLYQTVPDDPDTAIILETTANRAGDDFHVEWERAREERSDFFPLFIPWFAHEEYSTPFRDQEEKSQFEREMSQSSDHAYGNEWLVLETHPELTVENLKWRRAAIRNRCQGSLFEFNRQYPSTAEEAFQVAGNNVFDLGVLSRQLKKVRPPASRGYFEPSPHGTAFKEDGQGIVQLWQDPDNHAEYVMGSDHAEGLDSGDFSAAIMLRRLPLQLAGTIRGFDGRQVTVDEFAEQMHYMMQYFGQRTWCCPENNADGGSIVTLLSNQYRHKWMVTEKMLGFSQTDRMGWRNTSSTRRRGIARLQEAIKDEEIEVLDERFVREAMSFVALNGKPQAAKKGKSRRVGEPADGFYDDMIFAMVGALFAHDALPIPKPATYLRNNYQEGRTILHPEMVSKSWLDYA